MDNSIRTKRLGGTIRKHLSEIMAREVLDPRLAALAIESVQMSGDLSIANVTVRLMYGSDDPEARAVALKSATAVAPGLRAALAPILKMRRVPELRFRYDEGQEHSRRIEAVLAEIQKEDSSRVAINGEQPHVGDPSGGQAADSDAVDGPTADKDAANDS